MVTQGLRARSLFRENQMGQTAQVRRDAFTETRLVDTPLAPLGEGEVRLRVESFSVTANNVTYAVAGDSFGYWNFFPAEEGWGVVPMWGHAVVEASNHPDVAPGERVYGYLPMASHLTVVPTNVSPGSFSDAAAHRQPMSPVYNQYSRLAVDPDHDPAREGERMIYGGLFRTGYLIETMMRGEGWFGAKVLICTSASSKTAMGLASVAREKSPQIRRIGLTAAGNAEFVRSTGLYDDVVTYDNIASLPQVPSVVVDFAGNAAVVRAVHTTLGDNLRFSSMVGATHVGAGFGGTGDPLPGPAPVMFFAPDYAVAAIKEQGPKAFSEAVAVSWNKFLDAAGSAVRIDERYGLQAALDAFVATAQGKAHPSVGIVIRP
jgi:NADPH:quinone reductase-like Zn-dependent oxidoreductase